MELPQLHGILLDLLEDLDTFCRTRGIVYYLAGGTLLGAVRHGGFIPWDDDADVMMDRENYDKFIAARKELPPHLFLQCAENDPCWHYAYAKLRLNGTRCETEFSARFPQMHQGIFLDIFVQDATADQPAAVRRHIRDVQLWHALVRYRWHRDAGAAASLHTAWPLRLLGSLLPLTAAERRLDKAMRRYQTARTASLLDTGGMHLTAGSYPAAWLGTPKTVDFAGLSLPVPADADAYLTYLYGDYRTPAPAPPHSITAIDAGDYVPRHRPV